MIHVFNFVRYIYRELKCEYARKCILYGFPCEMDFSRLQIPPSMQAPRVCICRLNCSEKNPSHMEIHTKCIYFFVTADGYYMKYICVFQLSGTWYSLTETRQGQGHWTGIVIDMKQTEDGQVLLSTVGARLSDSEHTKH